MSEYPGLQHFKVGFSNLSQRSGNEKREIKKVMLGLFADAVPTTTQQAACAQLNFCYYACWEQHNSNSLDAMEDALDTFHANKHVFVKLGVCKHLSFQKLHSLKHYVHSIYLFGTADGYSTETLEHLHINFAKRAYQLTNRQDFTAQMTQWLVCRKKMACFEFYQAWLDCVNLERVAALVESVEHLAHVGGRLPQESCHTTRTHLTYEIAKSPSFCGVLTAMIIKKYQAPTFFDTINTFLCSHSPCPLPYTLINTTCSDLYTQFVILIPGNPQTGSTLQRDHI
jgi:hypothetical protein